jgi:chromosomal replication initiator protein
MQSWKSFLDFALANKVFSPIIMSLLKHAHCKQKANTFYIAIDNVGGYKFLSGNAKKIESVARDFFDTPTLLVMIEYLEKEGRTSPIKPTNLPLVSYQEPLDDLVVKCGLRVQNSFNNFAVSTSNNLAYAAAMAIAKNPGTSYNPLFLYGGVGVGKTHLAQAIGRKILEDNRAKHVFFAPGDMFTNEVIESIRERKTTTLRKKYRKLDLLIIDDVQFIAGKEAIQEEFFHTFNSIIAGGGQVILTSDKPPHEIKNLEDRLRSRFSGGLLVDIKQPDFELKSAIVLIKTKEKGLVVDIESAKLIAERSSDTRTLEGTLLTLQAKAFMEQKTLSREFIEDFFLIVKTQQETSFKPKILPSDVIRIVCSYYNIKQTHVKSSLRTDEIALPRQIIMFLLRNYLHMTLESIAFLIKKKDHTTIIHGIQKIQQKITRDPMFKEEVSRLKESLNLAS